MSTTDTMSITGHALLLYIAQRMSGRGMTPMVGVWGEDREFAEHVANAASNSSGSRPHRWVICEIDYSSPMFTIAVTPVRVAYLRWYPGNQDELLRFRNLPFDPRLCIEVRLDSAGNAVCLYNDFEREPTREPEVIAISGTGEPVGPPRCLNLKRMSETPLFVRLYFAYVRAGLDSAELIARRLAFCQDLASSSLTDVEMQALAAHFE